MKKVITLVVLAGIVLGTSGCHIGDYDAPAMPTHPPASGSKAPQPKAD